MQKSSPIEITYEDDYLVVAEKPSGLLSVPTPKKETHTLTDLLNSQFKDALNGVRLYPCHRLDRDTSGLIIYAKGKRLYRLMAEQFKLHKINKKYLAFVHGRLKNAQGTIKKSIAESPLKDRWGKRRPKPAVTHYRVLEEKGYYSIVEVVPITGRTNQIRIHFAQLGHPIVGERKYAFGRDFSIRFKRVALHAARLEFWHPISKKKVCLSSTLPKDMAKFIVNHK